MGLLNWWINRRKKRKSPIGGCVAHDIIEDSTVGGVTEAFGEIMRLLPDEDDERKKPIIPEPTPSPSDFNLPLEKPSPGSDHHYSPSHLDSSHEHHHHDSGSSYHGSDSSSSYDSGSSSDCGSCDSSSSSSSD